MHAAQRLQLLLPSQVFGQDKLAACVLTGSLSNQGSRAAGRTSSLGNVSTTHGSIGSLHDGLELQLWCFSPDGFCHSIYPWNKTGFKHLR